jgi:hypothetical protein
VDEKAGTNRPQAPQGQQAPQGHKEAREQVEERKPLGEVIGLKKNESTTFCLGDIIKIPNFAIPKHL